MTFHTKISKFYEFYEFLRNLSIFDNIIEKVVWSVFITNFYNTFINIKLLLIHYLSREMLLNVFSNNSKY